MPLPPRIDSDHDPLWAGASRRATSEGRRNRGVHRATHELRGPIVEVPGEDYPATLGGTPYSVPRPFVLDVRAAGELGYSSATIYADAVKLTCKWLVETASDGDWRERFPWFSPAPGPLRLSRGRSPSRRHCMTGMECLVDGNGTPPPRLSRRRQDDARVPPGARASCRALHARRMDDASLRQ